MIIAVYFLRTESYSRIIKIIIATDIKIKPLCNYRESDKNEYL